VFSSETRAQALRVGFIAKSVLPSSEKEMEES